MKRNKHATVGKRLLALLLAASLCLSLPTNSVFAAEIEQLSTEHADTVEQESEKETNTEESAEQEAVSMAEVLPEETSEEEPNLVTETEPEKSEQDVVMDIPISTYSSGGTCGENVTWKLDDDGTLTISGTGAMYDYKSYSILPWSWMNKSVTRIVIESGITHIGANAFGSVYSCVNCTEVYIANTVTSIGTRAFTSCSSLEQISIPNSVTDIGDSAFAYCSSLMSVTISGRVTSIGDYAFYSCSSLTNVTIPDGVTSINRYTFCDCSSLMSVTMPDSLVSVGDHAFFGCSSLTSVIIPDGVTSIDNDAFSGCSSLTSITMPASVTSIDVRAFQNCSGLTTAGPIGGSYDYEFSWTEEIPAFAFSYCSGLTSVTIPNGITKIGESAFSYCSSLTGVIIPDGVTSIAIDAFSDCSSLMSVTMPASVASIGVGAFQNCSGLTTAGPIGGSYDYEFGWTEEILDCAFSGCSGLISVTIPDGITSIGRYAFSGCSSLESVMMPASVTSIGYYAFKNCSGLTTAGPIGGGYDYEFGWTEEIPARAFSYCSGLINVTIPDGVTSIDREAFFDCNSLKSVTMPASVASIGSHVFSGCSGLTTAGPIGGGYDYEFGWTEEIPTRAFSGCSGLTSMTMPASITSIGDYVFSGCSGLTTAGPIGGGYDYEFGWTEEIPARAFSYCSGLISVTIPDGVTNIDQEAFSHCSSLESVTMPASVTRIGDSAFSYCSSLKDVTIPTRVTSISNAIFFKCSSLESVTMPASVTRIGSSAFSYCSSLKSVEIPDGVTNIDGNAFSYCSSLKSVEIPDGVTSIGSIAFSDCSNLTRIRFTGDVPYIYNNNCFNSVTAVAYYPENNDTWSDIAVNPMDHQYGGTITWVAWNPETGTVNNSKPYVTSYDGTFSYRHDQEKGAVDNSENCSYKDSFFSEPSTKYNHDLARMSLSLAMSAFNSSNGSVAKKLVDATKYTYLNTDSSFALENTPAKNVTNLLYNCGFSDIAVNEDFLVSTKYASGDAQYENDGNNIGVCFGQKAMADDYTLIAVAIRGAGYGDEWIGNLNIYNEGKDSHPGFRIAADTVLKELNRYVDRHSISGKLKIWVTGYSRAAATSNLVAARLCEGSFSGSCSLEPEDVYGYTFETPMGTKDTNAHNKIYNGIWNIANPIDLVTKVAMTEWGYTRYGNTVYLPSKYVNYQTYAKYCLVAGDLFNAYSGISGAEGTEPPHIAEQLFFVNNVANLVATTLENDGTFRTKILSNEAQDYFKNGKELNTYTLEALITETAVFMITHLSLIPAVIGGYVFKDNLGEYFSTVAISHYPEMTLAWMKTIPESALYKEEGTCRLITIKCPVDIAVYDENGTLQLEIIDDKVYQADGSYIEAIVDGNGQKIVCVPEDVHVSVEVTATGEGTFNYAVKEMKVASGEITRVVNHYDIPISEGDNFQGEIPSIDSAEKEGYKLYDEKNQEITASEVYTDEEIPVYTVQVHSEGNGTAVGASTKVRGEFVKVFATPGEEAEFLGWYVNGELVSEELEYRFRVMDDVSIIGKFTNYVHSYEQPVFNWSDDNTCTATFTCVDGDDVQTVTCIVTSKTIQADCTQNGALVYTASAILNGEIYEDSRTVPVPATGHNYRYTDNGDGTHTKHCIVCDDESIEDHTYENGICTLCEAVEHSIHIHTSGEAVRENVVPASCTVDGRYDSVVYCTVCGEELSRETVMVPASGHTYGYTNNGDGTHTRYCSSCEDVFTEVHTYENGICALCGAVEPAIHIHTPGEAVRENEVLATCTEDGCYDSVVYCTVCGEELSRETVVVPASGHTYEDGICISCGTKAPVDPEKPVSPTESNDTDEPTDPVQPSTPDRTSPSTGDEQNVALWSILLMVAGIGLVSIFFIKRKRLHK